MMILSLGIRNKLSNSRPLLVPCLRAQFSAVRRATPYTRADIGYWLARIQAGVFEGNPASVRMLEKAGYQFEGRLRKSIVKNGGLLDRLMYARLAAHG